MKRILLTGFEPFGGETINPSWEAVKTFQGSKINNAEIYVWRLPVVWGEIEKEFAKAVEECQPDIIISVGQAGGRSAIALERVAVNRANGTDNAGELAVEKIIRTDGPEAYLSTLPLKEAEKALHESGVPAYISNSAGLYLCNYVFYIGRHFAEKQGKTIPTGFVHIPFIPAQVVAKERQDRFPSMTLPLIIEALHVIMDVASR